MIWKLLKPYFSRKEKWGDPDKINPTLLFFLFEFRKTFPDGVYMNINCGWEERPTGGGHPDGRAVDVHISGSPFLVVEEKLQEFIGQEGVKNWIALGIYPEWGNFKRPGFHIEIEKKERKKPRSWGAKYVRKENGEIVFENGIPLQDYAAYALSLQEVRLKYQ